MPHTMTQNDPGSLGNTWRASKRTSQSYNRNWCFTIWKTDERMTQKLITFLDECDWWIYQLEEGGEKGGKHFQGCFGYNDKIDLQNLKNIFPKEHFEIMKKKEWAVKYCGKQATRLAGPWFKGVQPPKDIEILTKEQLYPWQLEVENLIFTKPDGRHIHVFYDPTGCTGKSALAKRFAVLYPKKVCIITTNKSSDIVTAVEEHYDTYILDFPRSMDPKFCPFGAIEQIKNGLVTEAKLKKKMKTTIFNHPHVIIFTNHLFDNSKLSKDRWIIHNISQNTITEDNSAARCTEASYDETFIATI